MSSNKVNTNSSAIVKNYLKKLIEIKPVLVALTISLLCTAFFLVIGWKDLPFTVAIGQRNLGVSLLAVVFLITFLVCYYSAWSDFRKIITWVQTNLLTFYSFAYFIGVNAVNIQLFGLNLNTSLVGVLFSLLIFAVNLNLFGKAQGKMYLVVPQIILFSLQTFSFTNLLETDKTPLRAFTTGWIEFLFDLNNIFWLVFCALSVSLVSVFSYNLASIKKNLLFVSVFVILVLEILFAVDNIAGLNYWYKALLFLVFWDFIYNPFFNIVNNVFDKNFKPKLAISVIYHLILIIVVIAGKPIFG